MDDSSVSPLLNLSSHRVIAVTQAFKVIRFLLRFVHIVAFISKPLRTSLKAAVVSRSTVIFLHLSLSNTQSEVVNAHHCFFSTFFSALSSCICYAWFFPSLGDSRAQMVFPRYDHGYISADQPSFQRRMLKVACVRGMCPPYILLDLPLPRFNSCHVAWLMGCCLCDSMFPMKHAHPCVKDWSVACKLHGTLINGNFNERHF